MLGNHKNRRDDYYEDEYYDEYDEYDEYDDNVYYDDEDEYYDEEDVEELPPIGEKRLTLKQKMMIVSRRDRMGRLAPRWYRVVAVILVLFIAMEVIALRQSQAWASSTVTATPVAENEVQLSFVGDVSLARYVEVYGESQGYASLFRDSSALWANSTYVFANLECALTRDNTTYYNNTAKAIKLAASVSVAGELADAGINVVSVANDHSVDYGRKGLRHELTALKNAGITYAGGGKGLEAAAQYVLLDCDGVTVAFLAFTDIIPDHFTATADGYGVLTPSYTNFYLQVNRASQEADVVIVYAHWGEDEVVSTTDEQETIAHQLIESGADIVIGSHPHVLQEIEEYQDGIIFYSLGNYIFDQANRSTRNTVMVQLNLNTETGEGEFTLIPMRINNFHACVTDSSYYISQIQSSLLSGLDKSAYTTTSDGRIHISMQLYEPSDESEEETLGGD